ncbi:NAD-dependent epimerase/dehydratase family protein, partial [Alphaproteobacteria bacterium]|nr:NAD-dependent epimerase/dehydratase family protein [Alphaproteobacteria bacterium]
MINYAKNKIEITNTLNKKYYLITGCAGFIGYHLSIKLLKKGKKVIGIDNLLSNNTSSSLKKKRLEEICKHKNFIFYKINLNSNSINNIFKKHVITHVFHLAAIAGVRYSFKYPDKYIYSNINGFYNIAKLSVKHKVKKFIYASSSSVYGENKSKQFSEKHNTDKPLQLYAVTKKSNEIMANFLSNHFKIPFIGLRFFTVYGPFGRTDMAPHIFINSIINRKKILLHNSGKHKRDFTYIDDIVNNMFLISNSKILDKKISNDNEYNYIFNIGSGNQISILNYIKIIEKITGLKANTKNIQLQPGEILNTLSNNKNIFNFTNYKSMYDIGLGT